MELAVAISQLLAAIVNGAGVREVRRCESQLSAAVARWGTALADVAAENTAKKLRP
jgi:hypothetical protein